MVRRSLLMAILLLHVCARQPNKLIINMVFSAHLLHLLTYLKVHLSGNINWYLTQELPLYAMLHKKLEVKEE